MGSHGNFAASGPCCISIRFSELEELEWMARCLEIRIQRSLKTFHLLVIPQPPYASTTRDLSRQPWALLLCFSCRYFFWAAKNLLRGCITLMSKRCRPWQWPLTCYRMPAGRDLSLPSWTNAGPLDVVLIECETTILPHYFHYTPPRPVNRPSLYCTGLKLAYQVKYAIEDYAER